MINMTPKNIVYRVARFAAGCMFVAALVLLIPGGIVFLAAWAVTQSTDTPDVYVDDIPLPPGMDIDE